MLGISDGVLVFIFSVAYKSGEETAVTVTVLLGIVQTVVPVVGFAKLVT